MSSEGKKKTQHDCNPYPGNNPPNYLFAPCSVWFQVLQLGHCSNLIYVHTFSVGLLVCSPSDRKIAVLVVSDSLSWTYSMSLRFCLSVGKLFNFSNFSITSSPGFCLFIHDYSNKFYCPASFRFIAPSTLCTTEGFLQNLIEAVLLWKTTLVKRQKATYVYAHVNKWLLMFRSKWVSSDKAVNAADGNVQRGWIRHLEVRLRDWRLLMFSVAYGQSVSLSYNHDTSDCSFSHENGWR